MLRGSGSFMFLFHLSPHSALIPVLQAHWHSGSMRTCLAPTPLSTLVAVSSLCFKFSSPLLLCSWSLLTFSYQFRWHLLESSFLAITSQIDHPIAPWKKSYDQPRQYIKKQRHYFANKDPSSQSYGFSSSHEWMWELDYKESWVPKNWCFWTVVLDKTLANPLDYKDIQPGNPKGNKSWIFIGRTDAEAETPIPWPSDVKNWLIGKDPDVGKDWRQEEKGTTEDEIVGWHHQLNGHEFE